MRLYHGSTVTVRRPNIQKGRRKTDFGKGFYTTTSFEQAAKWAVLKHKREHSLKQSYLYLKFPIIFSTWGIMCFDSKEQQKNG